MKAGSLRYRCHLHGGDVIVTCSASDELPASIEEITTGLPFQIDHQIEIGVGDRFPGDADVSQTDKISVFPDLKETIMVFESHAKRMMLFLEFAGKKVFGQCCCCKGIKTSKGSSNTTNTLPFGVSHIDPRGNSLEDCLFFICHTVD